VFLPKWVISSKFSILLCPVWNISSISSPTVLCIFPYFVYSPPSGNLLSVFTFHLFTGFLLSSVYNKT
jgi:hypothetical protein